MSHSRVFNRFFKQNLILLGLLGLISLSSVVSAEMKGFEDFSGKPQKLENYVGKDGKWLIVMMWASDCHICNWRYTRACADIGGATVQTRLSLAGWSLPPPHPACRISGRLH